MWVGNIDKLMQGHTLAFENLLLGVIDECSCGLTEGKTFQKQENLSRSQICTAFELVWKKII